MKHNTWLSDGCSGIPDSWVADDICCCFHDLEYWEGRPDGFKPSLTQRLYADLDIMYCLEASGTKLPTNKLCIPPKLVFIGLRLFGWIAYYL